MKLHLRIIEADNIPKMDIMGKADPYVVVSFTISKDTDQTEVIDKTYTPKWDKQMELRISSIDESVVFQLKDHDKVSKDDLIGSYKKTIQKFPPGIVTDEWIQLEKAKGVKKAARVHIISHLALDGMPPFNNIPFQFLKVAVKVISARDIEVMDVIGETDPYVVLYLRNNSNIQYKTKVLKNCMNPVWNQDFEINLLNQTSDILSLKMWDKDLIKDDEMSALDIPLGQFPLYEIIKREYDMKPQKRVKKGGKITIQLQVIPLGEKAWTVGPMAVTYPQGTPDPQFQMMMEQLQQIGGVMCQSDQ